MPVDRLPALYLGAFARGEEFEGGLAFRTALSQSNLDYSRESLARVDHLLQQVRARFKPEYSSFLDVQANQNFMYLLAFYVGTVIMKCSGRTVQWYDYDEMVRLMPDNAANFPRCFATSITCIYEGGIFYVPLSPIEEQLFGEPPGGTVAESAGKYIDLPPSQAPIKRVRPGSPSRRAPAGSAQAEAERTVETLGFLTAHAVWMIAEGGALAPMLLAADRTIRQLMLDDAVEVGRRMLETNSENAPQQCLVYDAFVNLETGRTDALVAEARRYGAAPFQLRIAVPYRPASANGGFKVRTPRVLDCSAEAKDWPGVFEAFYAGVDSFNQPSVVWPKEFD